MDFGFCLKTRQTKPTGGTWDLLKGVQYFMFDAQQTFLPYVSTTTEHIT